MLQWRNVVSLKGPFWQQRKVSRKTIYRFAGIGGSSKRMLICNGSDTNNNVRHESEPTSNWSKRLS
jgi:hypothetical protein